LREAFAPFITSLFQKFHESKFIWDAAVSIIAEIDCLASLAIVSSQFEGVMCRPDFIPSDEGDYINSSYLEI
jgi:DNA mismatch repair protein MSH6